VQSGFWLVLTEKSDSGFPVVNLVVRQLYFDGLLNSQSLAKIDSQKLITPHFRLDRLLAYEAAIALQIGDLSFCSNWKNIIWLVIQDSVHAQ